MSKRLFLSALLIVVVLATTAGAYAYFTASKDSGSLPITVGTASLQVFTFKDSNCITPVDGAAGLKSILFDSLKVPGDAASGCFTIKNTGDGTLDIYMKVTPSNNDGNKDLIDALQLTTTAPIPKACNGTRLVTDGTYTNGDGCLLATVASGSETGGIALSSLFVPNGNQDVLQGSKANITFTFKGYTTPH